MVLSRLTKITGPGIRTDTNWVGNNANYTGILTASSFIGDGSGLIGVASTDNIVTGTAATFNTYPVDINAGMTVAGVATFAGNVSIAGTLTYEDVTNIDSVGLVTARTGVVSPYADIDDFISVGSNIHLGNAGVVTATSFVGSGAALTGIDATSIKDSGGNVKIQAQASGAVYTGIHTFNSDLDVDGHTNLDNLSIAGVTTIANDTEFKIGSNANNKLPFKIKQDTGGGNVNYIDSRFTYFRSHAIRMYDQDNTSHQVAYFWNNQIGLYASNVETLRVAGSGVNILNGDLTVGRDIDVDGHTNLDNVSIAGVTTFAGDIRTYNIFPSGSNRDIGSVSNPFRDIHLSNDLSLIDNGLLKLGTDNDFLIQSTGNNNFIEGGTGFSGNLFVRAKLNQEGVKIESDGAVTLHHSGSAKLVTSSGGVGVTGDITVSGNVDGVDIAALNTTVGTKLANIVEDSSPQLGGELQSNGNHIRLSASKYIYFDPTGTGIAGYSGGVYFEGNSTGKTIYIRPKLNQDSIKALVDGAVVLPVSYTHLTLPTILLV